MLIPCSKGISNSPLPQTKIKLLGTAFKVSEIRPQSCVVILTSAVIELGAATQSPGLIPH